MSSEGFVSAGYVVVRRAARPRYVDSTTFPERIVSASDHLAPVLPAVPVGWIEAVGAPPGPFSGFADAAQGNLLWALEADLQRFGLDGALSIDLSDWLAAAWAHGDFHPPSAFSSLDAARRFAAAFGPLPADALIVGLALRASDVAAVTAVDDGVTCFSRLPTSGLAPEEDGEVVGFDVYGLDDGDLLPWLRRRGAVESVGAAGLRPNGWGLFSGLEPAARAAAILAREGGTWFPWRLTAYEPSPG